MEDDVREYIAALVNEFAKKFGLSDKQAYNYIRHHQSVDFIEQNYNIIHTLDFDEALYSVATFLPQNRRQTIRLFEQYECVMVAFVAEDGLGET